MPCCKVGDASGCGGAFGLWSRGGVGGAGKEVEAKLDVGLGKNGLDDRERVGVEEQRKHGRGDGGLDVERVGGGGPGRVGKLVGGGLLAFPGGKGVDRGVLEGFEVERGCRDEVRALGWGGGFRGFGESQGAFEGGWFRGRGGDGAEALWCGGEGWEGKAFCGAGFDGWTAELGDCRRA